MWYSRSVFIGAFGLVLISIISPSYGIVWYVSPDGAGDGASWDTAGALQAVVSAAEMYDEVWVAEGTYTSLTEDTVLNMKAGVNLYGGFAGTETDREQRNWEIYPAIIDGEETRQCVVGADAAWLAGFTLTRAAAVYGSALYVDSVSPTVADCSIINNSYSSGSAVYLQGNASSTFTNCVFSGNTADSGAALYVNSPAEPTLINCLLEGNTATENGGAIYCANGGVSDPTYIYIYGCTFNDNHAVEGGAIHSVQPYSAIIIDSSFTGNTGNALYYSYSWSTIDRCVFQNNEGAVHNLHAISTISNSQFSNNYTESGAAIFGFFGKTTVTSCEFESNSASYEGGAICLKYDDYQLYPEITNCVFLSNSAERGGAITVYDINEIFMTNCTFVNNTAGYRGGAIMSSSMGIGGYNQLFVTNCILWNNTAPEYPQIFAYDPYNRSQITYSCVQDGYEGAGNISDDPRFVNSPDDLQLLIGSPCVDAGTSENAPAVDILGNMRPIGDGIDIGAYEGSVIPEDAVTLTMDVSPPGTGVTIPEGITYYVLGDTANIYASSYTHKFDHWSGDASGANPASTVLMDSDKSVTAVFTERPVYYVDDDSAAVSPDGLSWETAFPDIQSAVDMAAVESGNVWVAAGAYTSMLGTAVLNMKQGVAIYGGFAGNETELSQRDWETNVTVIDGRGILRCVEGANYGVLSGFTITNGAATYGGGMYIDGNTTTVTDCKFVNNRADDFGGALYVEGNCKPTLINCVFSENDATDGGALRIASPADLTITNCDFERNSASDEGGAIFCARRSYVQSVADYVTISGCTFSDNSADEGGAINSTTTYSLIIDNSTFNENSSTAIYTTYSWLTLEQCSFSGNEKAIFSKNGKSFLSGCTFKDNYDAYGGAIYNNRNTPNITNCLFLANHASERGGALIFDHCSTGSIMNSTFAGNTAGETGGAIGLYYSSITATNSILWNNTAQYGPEIGDIENSGSTADVTWSCVRGGYPGTGNINNDPLFVYGPYIVQLLSDSPCIDTGTADGAPATDIQGNVRPIGAAVDMGAYEGSANLEDFVSLTVDVSPAGAGTTIPEGITYHLLGDAVNIYASSDTYQFDHWSGDASGTEPTTTVIMDDDKSVTAVFKEKTIYHVDAASTAPNPDGLSWETAFEDIQSAVDAAATKKDIVWVAGGTYTKLIGDTVLNMKTGVAIYGGFAGNETALDQRDWKANVTVIDGKGLRRCVNGADYGWLCGFTLTNGTATHGGGMYMDTVNTTVADCTFVYNSANTGGACYVRGECMPTLSNCVFAENSAVDGGALRVASPADLTLSNCVFENNNAFDEGGAIHCARDSYYLQGADYVIMSHCTFNNNNARHGGAINTFTTYSLIITDTKFTGNKNIALHAQYSWLTLERCSFFNNNLAIYNHNNKSFLTDCRFSNNYTNANGGAIRYSYGREQTLTNCVFQSNTTNSQGGAIYLGSSDDTQITNCTFSGNTSNDIGGAIYHSYSTFVITNSILWDNRAYENPEISGTQGSYDTHQIIWSCIEGGYEGIGNISDDPLFLDGPHSVQLQPGSPCIDSGTSDGSPDTDILGRARPEGAGVDMGAYEGSIAPEDVVSLTLDITPPESGYTLPEGMALYALGETAHLYASSYENKFSHWTGDVAGTSPAATLLMDGDKTATAVFIAKPVYHVNAASTTTSPDGLSWATAYPDLQTAVDVAAKEIGEVWVATGAYTASVWNSAVLNMKEGVTIYGGFLGNETYREQRDWTANPTILDGQYAYRCVNGANNAGLDGFTITRGVAEQGAGIRAIYTSPTIVNCHINNNIAVNYGGGGLYCLDSMPILINCVFSENTAYDSGGAIYIQDSVPTLTNCTFTENLAISYGGALYFERYNHVSPSTVITNCILWGNWAGGANPEISVRQGHIPYITYSCIAGGYEFAGEGTIDADPLFMNVALGDWSLQEGSPCIDAGTADDAPALDILGVIRPQGDGYDMGAYEYVPDVVEGEGEPPEGEGEPAEGEPAEGEIEGEGEGEVIEGELVEGEPVEGEPVEGEPIEGELEGEPVEGEVEGEGETIEGEPAEGEPAEGEPVEGETEGESVEGETEGEGIEGEDIEGESAEGESVEGETEGEGIEGESAEGESVEGETEGEGIEGEILEGEGETDTLEEIANDLENAFDATDTDGDGQLSVEEALVLIPNLSVSDFTALDLNGDGFLSLAELQGLQETCKCGCGRICCKTELTPVETVKRMLGDWLLIGLSLLVLTAFKNARKQ